MKLQTLKNKLAKLNVTTSVLDYNGFNQALVFTLNGKTFEADYNTSSEVIEMYSFAYSYCVSSQETLRHFFTSFNQVLKYSEKAL